MLNAIFCEFLRIILWFVEPHNQSDTKLLKDWNIVLWRERSILVCYIKWPRKRYELAWNSPIEISIFNFFIVLIFSNIKSAIIIPLQFNGKIQPIEAMIDGTLVRAGSHDGISKWCKFVMIWCKYFPCFSGAFLQYDDHECSHQKCSISLLGII